MFDWLYGVDFKILYPVTVLLIAGAVELGAWIRRRLQDVGPDMATLTASALGLLALLLGFSFSLALARYEARIEVTVEEANAIGSTANFALMLPESAQKPILSLLHDYIALRIGLGLPYDPAKLERDIARSLDLQAKLWQHAVAVSTAAPQSLPVDRFVGSLNEMNNIHAKRLTALRYHVPGAVLALLIGVSMVAMLFTGYHAGMGRFRGHLTALIMSLTVATVIMMIVDLDRPARGLVNVSPQALVEAAQSLPP
jgi:hypothetical protein